MVGPDDDEIVAIVKLMSGTFKITDEGSLADFLGVKIRKDEQGSMLLTQTHMIESILHYLDVNLEIYAKCTTSAMPSKLLTRDTDGKEFVRDWEYRSVIGKLNYLEKCTRPDLAFAVHQCARFSSDPRESHAIAVERIGRYLSNNKDKGIIIRPDINAEIGRASCRERV